MFVQQSYKRKALSNRFSVRAREHVVKNGRWQSSLGVDVVYAPSTAQRVCVSSDDTVQRGGGGQEGDPDLMC